MKFLEPTKKPSVIYTENSLEFGKVCEDLSRNQIILETLPVNTTQRRNKVERAARRVEGGTSAALLQSGLGNESWADSMECNCYLRNIQDLLSDGKTRHHVKGGSECPLTDHRHRLEQWPNITLSLRKSNLDCISLEQKSCQVFSSVMHKTREISGNETF